MSQHNVLVFGIYNRHYGQVREFHLRAVYILQGEELSLFGTYTYREARKCIHNLLDVSTDSFKVERNCNIQCVV